MVVPKLPLLPPRHLRKFQITDIICCFFGIYAFHEIKFPKVEKKIGYFRFKRKEQANKQLKH